MNKNVASQKVTLFAVDVATGLGKTGDAANLTAYLSKDDGSVTALTDTSATEADATNAKGDYLFDVSQAESNANKLRFTGKSSTAGVFVIPQTIYTRPANFSTFAVDTSGRVDIGKWLGDTVYNSNFTLANVNAAGGTITLPALYSDGTSTLPNDASHAGKILIHTGGNGGGEVLILTTRVGSTREWNVVGMPTTSALDTTSRFDVIGSALATQNVQSRIPAALTTDGNIKADALRLGGTTQTGADVGALAGTTNTRVVLALPAVAPNANGGLPILSLAGTTLNYTLTTVTQALEVTNNILGSVLGGVVGPVGSVNGNVGGSVGSVATGGITAASIATDALGALELSAGTADEIADAILDRADGIETGLTPRGTFRLIAAVLNGKVSGAGTGSEVFRAAVSDSKTRVTYTVDSVGNRTSVSYDVT